MVFSAGGSTCLWTGVWCVLVARVCVLVDGCGWWVVGCSGMGAGVHVRPGERAGCVLDSSEEVVALSFSSCLAAVASRHGY